MIPCFHLWLGEAVRESWAMRDRVLVAGLFLVILALPVQAQRVTEAEQALARLRADTNLATAFRDVAKALRPSVVSVASFQVGAGGNGLSARPVLPPEFEEFFGRDFFDGLERNDRRDRGPRRRRTGMGTGVIVSSDGFILTNNHVVQGANEVKVTLSDSSQFDAQIIGADEQTDVAVLKIETDGLFAAELGNSDQIEVGEWVVAIGSPFGLKQTVTSGILSAKGRANMGLAEYEDFLQTDAAINPGNSGGPLVNLRGQVIGINTAIASRSGGSMGVGFAIPSNMAQTVMQRIRTDGRVERGFLAISIRNLDDDIASELGFPGTQGVLVHRPQPGGPADQAGVETGDVILAFNGKQVRNINELRNKVALTPPDTRSSLRIFRKGQEMDLPVVIGRLDDFEPRPAVAAGAVSGLGMTAQTITPRLARELGLDPRSEGLVVTQIEPDSGAEAAGLRSGDLIVAVNEVKIATADEFLAAARRADLDAGLQLEILRDGQRRAVVVRPTN